MISVQSLHTFQLDASAKRISKISNIESLSRLKGYVNGKDFVLIGEGSNTVFLEDYYGEVVKLELFGKTLEELEDSFVIKVGASENWHQFVLWCLANSIFGLENLALIPGTVGASPIQNIGAYGREVKEFIERVEFYDLEAGEFKTISNGQCSFGYRDSIFKNELKANSIITSVTFKVPKKWVPIVSYGELSKLESPSPQDIFDKVVETRESKLPNPIELGNAGSFFKNPIVTAKFAETLRTQYESMPSYSAGEGMVKLAAGWLIDQCGLKGFEFQGISVHHMQALVLVNKSGKASGASLLNVIKEVQQQVLNKFDVELEPEVRLIGKSGEVRNIGSL